MRILMLRPTGVVAMQRVLHWMAERQETVWVVAHIGRYRSKVPAGFGVSPLLLPKGGWRVQAGARRAGLDSLAERTAAARLQRLARRFKPGTRVEHVRMGADTRRFRPGRTAAALEWRAFFGISTETFVLLSPRSWAEFYRHPAILQAYAATFPRLERPTVLAFVGLGDGPQALPHMARAWDAVAQTDAAPTVRWLPKIRYDEMHILYVMADAVANYPAQDSFPATIILRRSTWPPPAPASAVPRLGASSAPCWRSRPRQ